MEDGCVKLIAITFQSAEQADAGIRVAEDEAAEIAGKWLAAGPDRHEVVFGAEISQLHFAKPFLKCGPAPQALRSLAHIRADHAQLLNIKLIVIDDRRHLDAPIDRLESGIALENIEGNREQLVVQELAALAKEIDFAGTKGTLERRRRSGDLSDLNEAGAGRREVEKRVLADDWVVAFEHVLRVGIEDVAKSIRVILSRWKALAIAIPERKADAPAILDSFVFRIGAGARNDAARPREAERRIEDDFGNDEDALRIRRRLRNQRTVEYTRPAIGRHVGNLD